MSYRNCRLGHRFAFLAAALALATGSPSASALALDSLLVARGHVSPELAAVSDGLDEWLRERISHAGLGIVDGRTVRRAYRSLGGREPSTRDVMALARKLGAKRVLLVDAGLVRSRVDVDLRLYDVASNELLGGGSGTGVVAAIATVADTALRASLRVLGLSPSQLGPAERLGFDHLAASTRSLRALDDGRLVEAYRELVGDASARAHHLRERIEGAAAGPGVDSVQRARLLAAAGDGDAAWSLVADEAQAALARGSGSAALLLAAGEAQLRRGALREAEAFLTASLARDPRGADASIALGRLYATQRKRSAARDAFSRAAELEPSSPRAVELAADQEANDRRRAELLLEAGRRSIGRGSPARALTSLKVAAEAGGNTARSALREAGAVHAQMGNHQAALRSWERHDQLVGEATASGMFGIASAQAALGRAEDAQAAYLKLLDAQDEHAGALVGLGELHLEAGRADQAAVYLGRAVAAEPRDARAKRSLGRAVAATGDTARGLELYRAAELIGGASAGEHREMARLLRVQGDIAGAGAQLEKAVALRPLDADATLELAEIHEQQGDAAAAGRVRELAVRLGASRPVSQIERPRGAGSGVLEAELAWLVSSFAAGGDDRRAASLGVREAFDSPTHRVLAWLNWREPDRARIAAELDDAIAAAFKTQTVAAPPDFVARSVDALFDFDAERSLDATAISNVNMGLGADGVFVTRVVHRTTLQDAAAGACGETPHFELQVRWLVGDSVSGVEALGNSACIPGDLAQYGTINPRACATWAVVALIFGFFALRGRGRVAVDFKLPPKSRALFAVSLSRRPRKVKDGSDKSRLEAQSVFERQLRSVNRFERRLKGKHLEFTWVAARVRPYYVTVRGPLVDLATDELVGEFLEEQEVTVRRGQTARIEFDMCPSECAISVRVSQSGEPVPRARVSFLGRPDSVRYLSQGVAYLYGGKGRHVLLAGGDDRVAEQPVQIEELIPITLEIDLGREEGLLFKDCPDAVGRYLEGDFAAAADALERAGQSQVSHLVRARGHGERGDRTAQAEALRAAGQLTQSAELLSEGADLAGSAVLFEEAGEHLRAAQCFRQAGDLPAAARNFELGFDWANAVECYQEMEDHEKVLELQEKQGDFFAAGMLAAELGQRERAIADLQRVESRHGSYSEVCRRLGGLLADRGEVDLAIERFDQAREIGSTSDHALEDEKRYAQLLEEAGRVKDALSVYEGIRQRDLHYDDVATRIEVLRKHVTQLEQDEATQVVRAAPMAAPAQSSRYEILEELGRGGMGVVYKARDTHLERIVALKVLSENLRQHPAALKLFLREARAAAALNHSNIVTVFDAGQDGALDFISMEFLEGSGVDAILHARGPLDARAVASLGMQVCAGLDYAQKHRIVHRDIKPSNLFVTNDRVVKIMDFGLAKMVEEVRRQSTMIGGTPNFMAPEQAAGRAVDHRTDLYALGGTLFELLTGSVPFDGGDVTYHHAHTPAPDPRERIATVPAPMAQLVLKMLEKDPEKRVQSARAVAHAMNEILAGSS